MKAKLIIAAVCFFSAVESSAQNLPQLPFGVCGIVNIYDAAGNRTKRVYFCNNGDPYPQKNQQAGNTEKDEVPVIKSEPAEFQYVDALYPNPTTGKFFVTFTKSLVNAAVSITDNSGKTLLKFTASGNKVEFDLSPYTAGMYYVRIEEGSKTITKKVVKQ